jgi:hypothetical protein
MRLALAALLLAATLPAHGQACGARSGPHTAALVELYTSEGCDSCPPADRWLQSLGARGYAPDRVVPLSLHVDYWDYIGWKDPYAQQRFSERQRRLAQVMRARVVYTPQVLLQGRDFRRWHSGDFDGAVARINARPPQASIALRLEPGRKDMLVTEVEAALLDPARQADAALYLASYENKLVSSVAAGENRGRTLEHDYVVFEWVGPIPFTGGRIAERRALPLLPKAVRAHSGVAAFVQDRRTAEVLQALLLPACPA